MSDIKTVRANGLEFAYLEQGDGPLVLLLHGFPDNAHTWEYQMTALADAGYRAVAPWLRGYPPTEVPTNGFYDSATLATDAHDLIAVLGGGPAYLVGTDWGTLITYALLQTYPEDVRRAFVMAVPLTQAAADIVMRPELLHRLFYFWFFQLPGIPEVAFAANDFAFIDYLWRLWEPGFEDAAHVARVKETFAEEGAVGAAIGYYRAVFDPSRSDPALQELRAKMTGMIGVPTMLVFGRTDPYAVFADAHAPFFTGEFRVELVDGGEHFLHRSRPKETNELILSWLAAG